MHISEHNQLELTVFLSHPIIFKNVDLLKSLYGMSITMNLVLYIGIPKNWELTPIGVICNCNDYINGYSIVA